MVSIKNSKKGFSLVEVLITTIVMSMIMGSVLAFVQYAGNIWEKGQGEIDARNYSRMAFELIKDEMLRATKIGAPTEYNKEVTELVYNISDTESFSLLEEEGNLVKKAGTGSKPVKARLARNVKDFKVKRLSKRTLEIKLVIQKEQTEDEKLDGVEPEILSNETMVFIAPGVN